MCIDSWAILTFMERKQEFFFPYTVVTKAPSVKSCCMLESQIIVRFDKKKSIYTCSLMLSESIKWVNYYSSNTEIIVSLAFQHFHVTNLEN